MGMVLDVLAVVFMCISMLVFIVRSTKESGIGGFFSSFVMAALFFGWYFNNGLLIGLSMLTMFVIFLIIGIFLHMLPLMVMIYIIFWLLYLIFPDIAKSIVAILLSICMLRVCDK